MTFFWESDKAEKAEAESQICNFPGKLESVILLGWLSMQVVLVD